MKFNRTTCRHIPSEEGNSPIVIRVSYNGKRVNLHTGFTCDKAKWDKKREKVKNGSKVNGYDYKIFCFPSPTFFVRIRLRLY